MSSTPPSGGPDTAPPPGAKTSDAARAPGYSPQSRGARAPRTPWVDEFAEPRANRRLARRVMRIIGPAMGAVWIVFLGYGWTAAWAYTGPEAIRIVSLLAVVAQAVGFVFLVVSRRGSPWTKPMGNREAKIFLGIQVLLIAISCMAAHESGLVGLVFVSIAAVLLFREPRALLATAVSAVLIVVVPRLIPGWQTIDDLILSLVLAVAAVYGFTQLIERNRQLRLAQDEVAVLAVERERERIARDMHDVLGHSLTVVAVKAELAGKLVDRDPDRALAEIVEVQSLARAALADVRGMVSATRDLTLAGEIAGARAAFDAAGVAATLPRTVDEVPENLRELFAWTVREGTTNILRHSAAQRVIIDIGPDRITIDDDGRGPDGARHEAVNGLRGLSERASRAGAELEVSTGQLGGYRLRVSRRISS